MSYRPYFTASIDELEQLVTGARELDTLKRIRDELRFRTTQRAQNLLRVTEDAIRARGLTDHQSPGQFKANSAETAKDLYSAKPSGFQTPGKPTSEANTYGASPPRGAAPPEHAHSRPSGASTPDRPTHLQNLARYYRDVLTVLSENSGRALRNLNVGRKYGLVADLSVFQVSLSTLLDSPNIRLERIVSDPEADDSIFETEEPDPSINASEEDEASPKYDPKVSEAHALIRIWRKRRQDVFNRETLLGIGLIRASTTRNAQPIGPIVCYRVRPNYDPETRKFSIEKIVETPFSNSTLLSQILSEDELSEIRQQILV